MSNMLKVRDDHVVLRFAESTASEPVYSGEFNKVPTAKKYRLETEEGPSWIKDGGFELKDLRGRIEPWLTSLFQSEHLSLLAGSGLTHAVHHIAAGRAAGDMGWIPMNVCNNEIQRAAKISADRAHRSEPNIEDQLRVANELLRGFEILEHGESGALLDDVKRIMDQFASSILKSETNIARAPDETRGQAFNYLVTFLMSFASRTGTRDRLNIFTTNYDRLIEAGAELAGIHLLDRFLGNLTPIFRSSRLDLDIHYNPPGIRGEPRYLEGVVRFTKLHGSVDWINIADDVRRIGIPFGATNVNAFLDAPGLGDSSTHKLMIYPNSAKDSETAQYPYVELFRDFAGAVCRPNNTLVTYGYSFGDEHINRVIRDMLTIPSTHLVVISYSDPLGRIMREYNNIGRPSQISLMIGPELADLKKLTENFLPKAAIDRTTFRMSDLLRQRMGTDSPKPPRSSDDFSNNGAATKS